MAKLPDLSLDKPKESLFTQLGRLPRWQAVIAVLPLGLLFVGGAIGGLTGVVAATANLNIARSGLASTLKVFAMVGVLMGAVLVYVGIALAVSGLF